jgi:hypothetical protein
MDPDYTYNLYKSALRNGDEATANDLLTDLCNWMERGGYAPLGWR